jgi:hypothetical protein
VKEEPGTCTRRIAAVEKVTQNTVMEMLNKLLQAYHLQWVQGITPAEYPGRAAFS